MEGNLIMQRMALAAAAAVLLLGGCAATVTREGGDRPLTVDQAATQNLIVTLTGSDVVLKSADWEAFKGAWRGALKSAAGNGVNVTFADKAPGAGAGTGTHVDIFVNDYRYLTAGARYGFGVMTGNAYVDSKAVFRDLRTGRVVGERIYKTSSSAWQGVFSAMTDKQLEAISKELLGDLRGGR